MLYVAIIPQRKTSRIIDHVATGPDRKNDEDAPQRALITQADRYGRHGRRIVIKLCETGRSAGTDRMERISTCAESSTTVAISLACPVDRCRPRIGRCDVRKAMARHQRRRVQISSVYDDRESKSAIQTGKINIRELLQLGQNQHSVRTQRMICRHPLLQRNIAEHPVLSTLVSTHVS